MGLKGLALIVIGVAPFLVRDLAFAAAKLPVEQLKSQTLGASTRQVATHDIKEGFALGTRRVVLDRWRDDPQAQERVGAVITYDLDLTRDGAVPVLRFSRPIHAHGRAGQASRGAAA